jgi:hypothetical protein
MTDTGLIEATSGTYRSRVDGTLVLSVEVEPRNAAAALALFAMPGTPLVVGRLVTEAEQPQMRGGPIAQWLGMRCKERAFQEWLDCESEQDARDAVCDQCGVGSRAEIDHFDTARELFEERIRKPWIEYVRETTRA